MHFLCSIAKFLSFLSFLFSHLMNLKKCIVAYVESKLQGVGVGGGRQETGTN
jgi:hypothetical protein